MLYKHGISFRMQQCSNVTKRHQSVVASLVGHTRPPMGHTCPPWGTLAPPMGHTCPPWGTLAPHGAHSPPMGHTRPPRGTSRTIDINYAYEQFNGIECKCMCREQVQTLLAMYMSLCMTSRTISSTTGHMHILYTVSVDKVWSTNHTHMGPLTTSHGTWSNTCEAIRIHFPLTRM